MEELSIEEKAKLYDKAIAHAKLLLKTIGNATLGNLVLKNEFENMFPELKDSEDERIRKALTQNLKERFGTKGNMGEGLDMPDVLAWLDKQGEQKPDKVVPKFKVGDWIIDVQGVSANQIIGHEDDGYYIKTSCSKFYLPMKLAEKNYRPWTIQDAKDGDLLADDYGIYIFDIFDESDERCFFVWELISTLKKCLKTNTCFVLQKFIQPPKNNVTFYFKRCTNRAMSGTLKRKS